ncbi:MAG: alpha,alpha-phosphotrehalase [Fusobacterium sp. JB021]|nr:alpha,alpha-phosphotrehalase [Fusobacterium sp. JB021]
MKKDWWKKSVVYQIYPKSFKDSNGDGFGDIVGIIEKLDYLKKLGVDILWITPMYVSPQNDNGYDIANYYEIDPKFGTMENFEILLKKAHEKGIKIIMDMVVNHTSTEHEWFKKALENKNSKYHNYYIWKENKGKIPNNWASKFGGSAWEYIEKLDEYYLHLFDITQADLNWESNELRKEIYKMMRFWLDKGIDGFRLDVVNLLSKDSSFKDDTYEKVNDDGRKYYTDGPKIHEYLQEMNREVFSKYEDIITVGEMSSTNIENSIKYTNEERKELNMVFNFHHLKVDYLNGDKWSLMEYNFKELRDILFSWQEGMQAGQGWSALFWSNHDQPRNISRFGNTKEYFNESGKTLGTAIHLMRGTPYIYQGEEIGMENPDFDSIEMYRDIESLNNYKILLEKGLTEKQVLEILKNKSRDNARTPIQWNGEKNAGFSNKEPWIPVGKNYKNINIENALREKASIFYHYKKLIKLRKKYDVISHGSFKKVYENQDGIFAYERIYSNEELLVVCNFSIEEKEIVIEDKFLKDGKVLISTYGDIFIEKKLKLKPFESFAYLIK